MANTLTKAGITTGNTVEAFHVTQSIDAFSGTEAYDISLSGSFNMTGSINGEPGVINPLTSSYAITASYADNALSAINTPNAVITASNTGNDDTIEFLKGGGGAFSVTVNNVVSSSYALTASYALSGGGGSTSPGGADTQIQFNDGGTFGGNSNFLLINASSSVQIGSSNTITNFISFAVGANHNITGQGSAAFGNNNDVTSNYSFAIGQGNLASGINSHAEGSQTIASGLGSHAEGNQTTASGSFSHAEGEQTKAIAINSHAEGNQTIASGAGSHAEGFLTTASGDYSHALGGATKALGNYSLSCGGFSIAYKDYSSAFNASFASGSYQTTVGINNVRSENDSSSTGDVFIVGNGPLIGSPSNAFRVSGSGECFSGTTFTNGGADYAEYFESHDGQAIPLGTVVELTGSYIKACETADNAIGVISNKPSILGNAEEGTADQWIGMYLKDEWGNYSYESYTFEDPLNVDENGDPITETGTRKVLNPDYDPSLPYTPRSSRPEWNVVGLLGQIRVLKNQNIPSRWIKMKDINDAIAIYLVK